MMKVSDALAVFIILGPTVLTAVAAASTEDFDALVIELGPRAEVLMMARCSVCHSADLITQQRLAPERWQVTVEKMKHWGAEISEEEEALLVRYLSARYHPGEPQRLRPHEAIVGPAQQGGKERSPIGPVVGVAGRGAAIFEHNCQACHGQAGIGGVGPKLANNPILKREDLFWNTVLDRRGPMPAWGSVLSGQDIADIHAWLLTR